MYEVDLWCVWMMCMYDVYVEVYAWSKGYLSSLCMKCIFDVYVWSIDYLSSLVYEVYVWCVCIVSTYEAYGMKCMYEVYVCDMCTKSDIEGMTMTATVMTYKVYGMWKHVWYQMLCMRYCLMYHLLFS